GRKKHPRSTGPASKDTAGPGAGSVTATSAADGAAARPNHGSPPPGPGAHSAVLSVSPGAVGPDAEDFAAPLGSTREAAGDVSGAARVINAPKMPAVQAETVELGSIDFASFRPLWDGFVTMVRLKKAVLGVSLIAGALKSFENDTVTLRFARGFSFQKEQVESEASKKFLKRMAKKYFGRELDLVCEGADPENTVGRRRAAGSEADGTESTPRGIDQKPLIKKILDDFDGEIVRYGPQ
ncbi:MAG: hypothetical protein P8181_04300, partial [bacterium]